jgi:Nucleotidyl transferase AbiEii toxin, Type IV TA system
MARNFATPAAFKASLEARLKKVAGERDTDINSLRLKLVIERLLARLFASPNPPWILKGGYAMELRYRPRARTTRDIDLTCAGDNATPLTARLIATRDQIQDAAEADLHDFLTFQIGTPTTELAGAPLGGARFPCEAFLAGKTYGRFHIDLGFGDDPGDAPDTLTGDDLMAFAEIPPAKVLAIPKPQQFAEKIHAYTKPWADRENMRTKDLVDLVLIIETASVTPDEVAIAAKRTFARRATHELPKILSEPPAIWADDFKSLAAEARIEANELEIAFQLLSQFWSKVMG